MSREMEILIDKLDRWQMSLIAGDYMTESEERTFKTLEGVQNRIKEAIAMAEEEAKHG